MDFTRNFKIAVFFAIYENIFEETLSHKDVAIWCMDRQYVIKRSFEHFSKYAIEKLHNEYKIAFNANSPIPLLEQKIIKLDAHKWFEIAINRDFPPDLYGMIGFDVPGYKAGYKRQQISKLIHTGRLYHQESAMIFPLNFSKSFEAKLVSDRRSTCIVHHES